MPKKSKQVGYEHLNVKDDGDVAGLWLIDGHKVRETFGVKRYWQGVDEIIKLYTQLHPNEMQITSVHNQLDRDDKNNEYGSNTSGAVRHALTIPYNLLLVLKDYDRDIIQNKAKRTAFMKRYPQLRACKVV